MGRNHIEAATGLGLELVGICDQNPETLAQTAREMDISPEKRFADASTLLEKTNPECVIIATTTPSHCPYTCMAAEAGARYILCEKPMAVSINQCNKMIDACQRAGTELAVNHQMRFMEQYTEPKRITQTEAFGGLSSVTVVAGNIGMAMNGSHMFEMFRYMTDEIPNQVTAWLSDDKVANPRGEEFEDRGGSIRMTTASGKRFYLEIGTDQGLGLKSVYSGPRGQIVVDELTGRIQVAVREEAGLDLPTTRYSAPWTETETMIEPASNIGPSQRVLEALINNQDAPTGADAKLVVSLLVAAYVSDENGHVPVTPDDPRLDVDREFPWA